MTVSNSQGSVSSSATLYVTGVAAPGNLSYADPSPTYNARVPIAPNQRWNLSFTAATAVMDYLPGTGQPDNSVSGVGAGILYRAPSDKFRLIVSYGYGFNANRGRGRGANSISLLMQIDLDQPHGDGFKSTQPDHWRGWNWLLGR